MTTNALYIAGGRTRYMLNPASGEIKLLVPSQAERLRFYGWQEVTKHQYDDYQKANREWLVKKYLEGVRVQ